jgi:hypothetical protein
MDEDALMPFHASQHARRHPASPAAAAAGGDSGGSGIAVPLARAPSGGSGLLMEDLMPLDLSRAGSGALIQQPRLGRRSGSRLYHRGLP